MKGEAMELILNTKQVKNNIRVQKNRSYYTV